MQIHALVSSQDFPLLPEEMLQLVMYLLLEA